MPWREWRVFRMFDVFEDRWLFATPVFEAGELVRWEGRANRMEGRRAIGGKLYLTDRRLIFVPHRFERLIRSKPWAWSLSEIHDVEADGQGSLFRRRLRVTGATGEQLFVVNDPGAAAASIEAWLRP